MIASTGFVHIERDWKMSPARVSVKQAFPSSLYRDSDANARKI